MKRISTCTALVVVSATAVVVGQKDPEPLIVIGTVTDVVSSGDPHPYLPPSVTVGAEVRGIFYWDPDLVDSNANENIGVYTVAQGTDPVPYFTWVVGQRDPEPLIVHTGPTGNLTFKLENDQFNLQVPGPIFDRFSLRSVGNVAEQQNPSPFIESIGFTLVDTTPHALSSDALVIPNLEDFTDTTSLIIRGCGTPGSGGSCLDPDASDDMFEIHAELTSMRQEVSGGIPTTSAWGIAVLALALLVVAKVRFGRHATNL